VSFEERIDRFDNETPMQ
jgi:hypothetical protein